MDLILYGEKGLIAIEVKNSDQIRTDDLKGLKLFGLDYPQTQLIFIYRGKKTEKRENILCVPAEDFFSNSAIKYI